jgi:hypothetical protein
MKPPPFAYGHSGLVIVTSDGSDVLVHRGEDEAPVWKDTLPSDVIALATTADRVVAADARGHARVYGAAKGDRVREIDAEFDTKALAAAGACVCMVGPEGAILFKDGERRELGLVGSIGAAFHGEGQVAVAETRGKVTVYDTTTGDVIGSAALPGRPAGIAWNSAGFFVVSLKAGDNAYLGAVAADGSKAVPLHGLGPFDIGRPTCSEDGRFVATRIGSDRVGVFELPKNRICGKITWVERRVGDVDFGPGTLLGVGLDLGDGNKIDLATGDVCRTDPHQGRKRNAWALLPELMEDRIGEALAARMRAPSFAEKPDTAEAPRTPREAPQRREAPGTTRRPARAVPWPGLIVAACLIVAILWFLSR